MAKFWTYENRLILMFSLTFGFVFFDRNALGYLAPFIERDLSLDNTQIGMMAGGLALGWAASGYFLALWSDRTGKRKVFVVATVALFSLCSFASGVVGSFLAMLIARMVMGATEGPFLPLSQSIILAESSEHRRGANMGWVQAVGSAVLGSCLAPIVVVAIANAASWRAAFMVVGIPGLIMAFLIARYVREPAKLPAMAPAPVTSGPAKSAALQVLAYRNVWLCMLIAGFMVAWMMIGWVLVPVYFVNYRHIDPFAMALLVSMFGLSSATFGAVVPALSDRLGRRPMMACFSLLSVICPMAALYYDGPLPVLGIFLFLGFCGGGIFPLMMATIPSETVPRQYTARAMAMVQGVGEVLGGVGGPWLGGWAADRYGLQAPLFIEAGCAVAGGVLCFFLIETAPIKLRRAGTIPGAAAVPASDAA